MTNLANFRNPHFFLLGSVNELGLGLKQIVVNEMNWNWVWVWAP